MISQRDACCGEGDFASNEGFAAAFAFVVEEYAAAAEHVVSFTILFGDPKAIEFGDGVGAVGVKGSVFVLRYGLHFAVEFGG